jgi:hypothetical protein
MPMDGIIELTFFIIAIVVLLKSRDWKGFFANDKSNLLLIIPIFTVLLPTTIGYPFSESLFFFQPALAVAHLFLLVLFTVAVLRTLRSLFQQKSQGSKKT